MQEDSELGGGRGRRARPAVDYTYKPVTVSIWNTIALTASPICSRVFPLGCAQKPKELRVAKNPRCKQCWQFTGDKLKKFQAPQVRVAVPIAVSPGFIHGTRAGTSGGTFTCV